MDECVSKQLCVISFLPHILDTGAAGRNEYIGLLKEMGNKYKQRSWGYVILLLCLQPTHSITVFCRWVWLEGGANMELETSLGVGGFGYPVSNHMISHDLCTM